MKIKHILLLLYLYYIIYGFKYFIKSTKYIPVFNIIYTLYFSLFYNYKYFFPFYSI